MLLALELAGFAFFVAGTHGWITPLRRPVSTDFVSFYAAGRLADAGTPALVYDQAAHYAAEQAATEPGIAYNYFYYPPVFLLLCAVLARLPYLAAFVAFQAGTLVPCAAGRSADPAGARLGGAAATAGVSAGVLHARHRTERVPDRRAVRSGDTAG